MKKLKKVTAKFLVLILIINTFVIVPLYDENYGDAVYADTVAEGGLPLYQANVIAKGYNNDGEGYYKLFKSFQNPVYYELTNYMLEDKILSWTSNFWNATFNSEFQKNPSYFYEVMLMGYLKYEQKEINTSGVWDSKEMALATEIYKELADQLTGSLETKNYNQILNQVDTMSNDELKRVLKNVDCIKLSSDILDDLSKGMDYGTEFIDAIAEYEALFDAKSERIESLKLLRAKVTDNDYFTKAVDDIIEKMEQTPINYVAGKMIDKLWDDFLNTAWNLIIEGSPIAAILKAINVEKMTLDVLFNSSDTASNNFKLLVLYIVDTYFDSALEQSLKNYNGMNSVSNGVTLIQCYKGYIEYQMYGLDYTKTFINDIVDEGSIHHIIEQIFFKESIQSAEELTRLCDSQIKSRQRILELLENSADIYYRKTGLDELVNELNKTEEKNVPVTSVSFSQSEITLKSMSDICFIYANVYPSNATNKKVTYTCSDPSILSVPAEGGFATQKGEGTVTVTATTEDGGLTDTQTVTVKYVPELTRDYHGKCGTNVYWTLYSDGTMYITGRGAMTSYSGYSKIPWNSYSSSIKNVIIGDGVTSISNNAFTGCYLEKIVIGDALKNLNGFRFDKNLKMIKIGNGVTKIDENTFKDCSNLESVTIGNSVTSIGHDAFYGCTNLVKTNYMGTMDQWAEIEFKGYYSSPTIYSKDLYIDDQLITEVELTIATKIGSVAFENCKSITKVIIPDSVLSIGKDAFRGCPLKNVVIGDGLKNLNGFSFDENLESITIGNSVASISSYAFAYCTNLARTNYTGTIEQWAEIEFSGEKSNPIYQSKKLYINDKLVTEVNLTRATKVSNYAFYNCINLARVEMSDNFTSDVSIGKYAFYNCTGLENVVIGNNVISIDSYAFGKCTNLAGIIIPDSVTSVGDHVFSGCTSLKNAVIGNNVTSMGNGTFVNCINLENVKIGESVTKIGSYAFYNCINLAKIIIPDSVISMGDNTFCNCTSLENAIIGNGVTSIEQGVFDKCTSLKSVTIGNSVTSIDNPFYYCSSINKINYTGTIDQWAEIEFCGLNSNPIYYSKDLYINDQLITEANLTRATKISNYAFYYCTNLKRVRISDSVKDIGDYAFDNCVNLENIIIPDSVKKIGVCAFRNCEAIKNVTIGKNITSIGTSAFENCKKIEKTNYTGTIDQWAEIIFSGYSNDYSSNPTFFSKDLYINNLLVTEINLTTATKINDYAFSKCKSLEKVTIGNSVKSIGKSAFSGCENIKSITVAESVMSIGEYAFGSCVSLEKTNYIGTIDQWVQIKFSSDESNPVWYSKNLYLNNELVTKAKIQTAERISDGVFANCLCLEEVTIPYGVTNIGCDAFSGCKNLKKTNYTGTIDQWVEIEFGNRDSNPMDYGGEFYIKDELLKNAELTTADKISEYAFMYCRSLESITIPSTVTEIGDYAFWDCSLNDIYYDGSENEWNDIKIDYNHNNDLKKEYINIHYNTTGNDYIVSEKIEPDCENDGEYVYTCPHGFTKTETISALWHEGNVKEIIPSTCSNSGYTLYECKRCGETYKSDYMKPLGHEFINGICKNCGKMEDECIESSHPYENDYDESWTINKAGAKSISITFSEDTEVEYGYDYIYIYDQNNNEVGCYTGNALASKTITVSGDTVKIRLKTDEGGVYYGFSIVSIKANYNELQKYNDFEYCALDDGTIEIISYIGSETKLRIPEKINDCPVTRIGNNTFNNNTKLEAIEIPTTIKSIGSNAFYGCTELKDVYYNGDSNYDLDDLIEIGDGNANLLIYSSIHYYSMEDNSDDKSDNVNETTTTTVAKPNIQETTTVAENKLGDNNTQKKIPTAKIKKVKRSKKSLKISWKRIKGVSGYQIQYSTSGKFKKSKKITIRKAQATLGNINKLKTKTKYYIRIRTYIVDNGKKKYSSWSKKVMQKTK